jgi:ATP-dependent RNA helicase DeaD
MKFKEINFRPEIQRALEEMGYVELSPIQEQTLLAILEQRDIVAIAETGSGKTSACGIPLTQLVDEHNREVQVLVMVPTRELALQYVEEIYNIAEYTEVSAAAIYGGADKHMQRQQLKHGAHILVATPGRLIDFLHDGELEFKSLQTLVLDEADEMLKMGFVEDVEFIMSCIRREHQTLLFSATMPRLLDGLINRFLREPVRIELNKRDVAPSSLTHEFIYTPKAADREQILFDFLEDRARYRQVLLFCNSRFKGNHLYRKVRRLGPRNDYLHGGMDQELRSRIFRKFKTGDLPVLIATDVAGRGLDFSNVSHVINYDFPRDAVTYTHRTGRAGRMGRPGTALSFVTDHDIRTCQQVIEQNRLSPVWHGPQPPAGGAPRQRRRQPRRSSRR